MWSEHAEVFGVWYADIFDNLDRSIRTCTDDLWLTSMWPVAKDPHHGRALGPDYEPHPLGIEVLSSVWQSVWHGLIASRANLVGRPAILQMPAEFAHLSTGAAARPPDTPGQVLPLVPPSRADMVAFLRYHGDFVMRRLGSVQELGDGQATYGSWRGALSDLLAMFRGDAIHLGGHGAAVLFFLWQHRDERDMTVIAAVLRRADEVLATEQCWSSTEGGPAAEGRYSLYRAIAIATAEVEGIFDDQGPGIEFARSLILERADREWAHPLVDFNAASSFADVKEFLRLAISTAERRSKS